jgi:hypothetical protein
MSKQHCVVALSLLIFLLSSCSSDHDSNLNKVDHSAIEVSIIQVIANPSDYHGQKIRVKGVGNAAYEGNGLYLNKNDWQYRVYTNGLWLQFGEGATPFEKAGKYNGKYVIVEGIFNMDFKGHFSMYSGAIVDITRYEPLKK